MCRASPRTILASIASFLVLGGPGAASAIAANQTITVVNSASVPKREIRDLERAPAVQALQLRHYWDTPVIRFGSGGWTLTLLPTRELPPAPLGTTDAYPTGYPRPA